MPSDARLLLAGHCSCRCHTPPDGGPGDLAVLCTDPVHAALACPVCRDHHVAALAGRPAELGRATRVGARA